MLGFPLRNHSSSVHLFRGELKVVQQGHDKGVEDGPLEATHLPQKTPRNMGIVYTEHPMVLQQLSACIVYINNIRTVLYIYNY